MFQPSNMARTVLPLLVGLCAFGCLAVAIGKLAVASGEQNGAEPVFTTAFLSDPAVISAGEVIWQEQCRHCHGASAYPGKAPKLKPRRYEPEFVYDRVTNGFRKMPAWDEIFDDQERMSVVAYILSESFSP